MRTFASMFLAVSLLACGGSSRPPATPAPAPVVAEPTPAEPAPPATPSDAELDGMFASTLVFLEDMAVAVETNATNCPAMGPALDLVFDKHAGLLALAKKHEGNAEVDAKAEAYMTANKPRVDAATSRMMGGLQSCGDDPGVQAAMQRFNSE